MLQGLLSEAVEGAADAPASSLVREDETYLIRGLLESFASSKLGNPHCKVTAGVPLSAVGNAYLLLPWQAELSLAVTAVFPSWVLMLLLFS